MSNMKLYNPLLNRLLQLQSPSLLNYLANIFILAFFHFSLCYYSRQGYIICGLPENNAYNLLGSMKISSRNSNPTSSNNPSRVQNGRRRRRRRSHISRLSLNFLLVLLLAVLDYLPISPDSATSQTRKSFPLDFLGVLADVVVISTHLEVTTETVPPGPPAPVAPTTTVATAIISSVSTEPTSTISTQAGTQSAFSTVGADPNSQPGVITTVVPNPTITTAAGGGVTAVPGIVGSAQNSQGQQSGTGTALGPTATAFTTAVTGGVTHSSTHPLSSNVSSTTTPSPDPTAASEKNQKLSVPFTAGINIGLVLILTGAAGTIYFCYRRRKSRSKIDRRTIRRIDSITTETMPFNKRHGFKRKDRDNLTSLDVPPNIDPETGLAILGPDQLPGSTSRSSLPDQSRSASYNSTPPLPQPNPSSDSISQSGTGPRYNQDAYNLSTSGYGYGQSQPHSSRSLAPGSAQTSTRERDSRQLHPVGESTYGTGYHGGGCRPSVTGRNLHPKSPPDQLTGNADNPSPYPQSAVEDRFPLSQSGSLRPDPLSIRNNRSSSVYSRNTQFPGYDLLEQSRRAFADVQSSDDEGFPLPDAEIARGPFNVPARRVLSQSQWDDASVHGDGIVPEIGNVNDERRRRNLSSEAPRRYRRK